MCVRALIHKFLFIPSDSDLSYTIEKEQVHTTTHICYLKARGGGTRVEGCMAQTPQP